MATLPSLRGRTGVNALLGTAAAVALAVAAVAWLARGGAGGQAPAGGGAGAPSLAPNVVLIPEAERRPLPAFEGPTLDGGRLDLASLTGQVVVLNFWASWCGPCRQEQAALQQAHESLSGTGVRLVGVNVRDDPVAARAHVEEFGVTYPSLRDDAGELAARLGRDAPAGPPYTLVVDERGRIAARVLGALGGGRASTAAQVAELREVIAAVRAG